MTDLRIHDALSVDRETTEEHLRHVLTMIDFFPVGASQAEQTIELLNIRRRASLALAALEKEHRKPNVGQLVADPYDLPPVRLMPASIVEEEDGS